MGNVSNFAKIISSGFLYVAANVTGVVDTSSARDSGTSAQKSMGALQAAIVRRAELQGAWRPVKPGYGSDPGPNGGPLSGASHALISSFHTHGKNNRTKKKEKKEKKKKQQQQGLAQLQQQQRKQQQQQQRKQQRQEQRQKQRGP